MKSSSPMVAGYLNLKNISSGWNGVQKLRINCPETEKLKDIAETLLQENNFGNNDAKVYIQITRGAAPRTHAFPDPNVSPTIYAAASAFQLSQQKWEHAAKVILVPDIQWARCDIKSVGLLPRIPWPFNRRKNRGQMKPYLSVTEWVPSQSVAI